MWTIRRLSAFLLVFVCISHPSPTVIHATAPIDKREDPTVAEAMQVWQPGLDLLRSTRVDEALAWFLSRQRQHPRDPCGYYLPAVVNLWFDSFTVDHEEQTQLGREQVEKGIQLREDDSPLVGPGYDYCYAALHGLRAAFRYEQNQRIRAAFDAKKARRLLLELRRQDPSCVDCRFWLGAYDYYLSSLPGFVRFVSPLIGLPSPDRTRGIEHLEAVVSEGAMERFAAQWVLRDVYATQRDFDSARQVLETLHDAYPDFVYTSLSLARYQADEEAEKTYRNALHRISSSDARFADRLESMIRRDLAGHYLRRLQAESAAQTLLPAVGDPRQDEQSQLELSRLFVTALNQSGQHQSAIGHLRKVESRFPESPFLKAVRHKTLEFDERSATVYSATVPPRLAGRAGDVSGAETQFRQLLEQFDDDEQIVFWMAETYFGVQSYGEAELLFREVLTANPEFPRFVRPRTAIYLGLLCNRDDRRKEAKTFFRLAHESAEGYPHLAEIASRHLK